MRFAIALFISCIIYNNCTAQIFPSETAVLNYILVPFQITATGNDSCTFEIAIGSHQQLNTFEKSIIIRQLGLKKGTVILLPGFNSEYTWRYMDKTAKPSKKEELHHFKTGYSKFSDTNYYRNRVITPPSGVDSNIYIFNDYQRTLSTLAGKVVWFLPDIPNVIDDNTLIRDLKPSGYGTLTFLTNESAYETDYNGNILWKAPNDGKISGAGKENYHHEFTRLPNRHYMLSGNLSIEKKVPASVSHTGKDNPGSLIVQYETLVEYNKDSTIAWSWKASEHIPDDIVFAKTNEDGTVNTSMHLNSFYFDEKKSCIYASFRDLSSIIKIDYPAGKVLNIYKGNTPGMSQQFKSQHSCRAGGNGDIYLYSNNNPGKNERASKEDKCVSTLVMLKENKGKLTKTWEFACDIDDNALPCTNSGGSIFMLRSGNFLVSMGSVNRNFIVSKDKKLLWNAVTEIKDGDGRWVPAGTYRISSLETRAQLEALLFHRN